MQTQENKISTNQSVARALQIPPLGGWGAKYITDLDGIPHGTSRPQRLDQYFWYSPCDRPDRGANQEGEALKDQKANTNAWESPYAFNGKELDEESGLYYYGARYYNPQVSVWLSVDRLAAKYPNSSPYVFTGNNPIMLIDPNGDSVNVALLQMFDQASGSSTTCKSVSDLEDLTGLSISINQNGNLAYGKDDDGNAIINNGGSQEARSLLMTAIDDKRTVNVTGTRGDRSYSAEGGNYFRLSSNQIESFISGTSHNLDSRTMGYGMVFLHELDHTMLGQGLGDNFAFGETGPIVDRMNLIRSQMGTNWGQRTSYSPGEAWGTSFIPMDNNSLQSLKHDMYPTSYIKR